MSELSNALKAVHEARAKAELARTALAEARRKWEEDNAVLFTARDEAEVVLEALTHELRLRAIYSHEMTGDTEPIPGVRIRHMTVLHYSEAQALEWAKAHGMALKLDKPLFEKLAKTANIPNVLIEQEHQAAISQDLTPFLPTVDSASA